MTNDNHTGRIMRMIHITRMKQMPTSNTKKAQKMSAFLLSREQEAILKILSETIGREPTESEREAALIGGFLGAGFMAERILDGRDMESIINN